MGLNTHLSFLKHPLAQPTFWDRSEALPSRQTTRAPIHLQEKVARDGSLDRSPVQWRASIVPLERHLAPAVHPVLPVALALYSIGALLNS